AEIVIHKPRLLRRLLLGGSIAFAEGYADADWDSPDLSALLTLLGSNIDHINNQSGGHWMVALVRRLGHWRNRNTRRGSRRNIAFHYDLGNDFYSHWLDPSLTYSAALFTRPDMTLTEAQMAKYRRLASALDLSPGQRLLEIGCGWGGFAELVARDYGCHVTAVTLSREQYDYARHRIQQAGLEDKVDIRLQDYRDVEGRFDRVASIEMFEAVGEEHWPTYFEALHNRLAPGGRAGLQIITIDHAHFDYYRRNPDFIQSYIFPGGMLPSTRVLGEMLDQFGLILCDAMTFGPDYARTLGHWREAFENNWPKIEACGFDQRFRRLWRYYLAYCEAGFTTGRIDVGQYVIRRS
ncbi:MAG: class I SAM-dependent methyltransferase, partial [Alphaproteobacteria bacterium]